MEAVTKKFKKLYLEITNICNLQCSFCPEVERPKATLSREDLKNYLQKLTPWADRLCFHVMGEPLNHPEFPAFVEEAGAVGAQLEITTNGVLLNQKLEQALLNPSVVQVNFSIQSFFDNFKSASPQKYLEKIFAFSQKARELRPDLYINYRLWNIQSEDEKDVTEYFLTALEKEFSVSINRRVDPAFNKSKKVIDKIYLHFDSRFEWPNPVSQMRGTKGRCHGTISHMAVHTNGDIVPCCLDKEARLLLGNLNQSSFEEVLQSERYQKMRKGFENNQLVEDLCQRCDYIQRFN